MPALHPHRLHDTILGGVLVVLTMLFTVGLLLESAYFRRVAIGLLVVIGALAMI